MSLRLLRAGGVLLLIATVLACPVAAMAQTGSGKGKPKPAAKPKPATGDSLIDKALNRLDWSPTVSATVTIALPGKASEVTGEMPAIVIKAKVKNNGKGRMAQSRFDFTAPPDSTPQAKAGQGEWTLLDDGKDLYTIFPQIKQIATDERQPDRFSNLFRPTIERIRARGVTFRATPDTVNGVPVYVIQGQSIDGFKAQVVVSRETGDLQSVLVATPTGRIVNQMTVTDINYKPTLAPADFQKPADYKPFNGS